MYPALAVLQALGDKVENVLWVGGEGGIEADMVKRENISFETIPAAGIHGVGVRSLPGNILQLTKGYFSSRMILKTFNPDVLLFTGGYVAVPMAMAAIPYQSLLYVPDIEPGLALKALARFSDQIALTTDKSQPYFQNHRNVSVTGYPTRSNLNDWTKEKAIKFFNLSSEKPVILILGGSKGARSINLAVGGNITGLLRMSQIIHITGQLDFVAADKIRDSLPEELKAGYHLFSYLHEMGAALAVADLAVSRSGASTLGEYPLYGLPSILVPYPYTWRYQKVNADYLAERGAAVVLEDSSLRESLLPLVQSIISDDLRLWEMKKASSKLSTPGASTKIADLIIELAGKSKRRSSSW